MQYWEEEILSPTPVPANLFPLFISYAFVFRSLCIWANPLKSFHFRTQKATLTKNDPQVKRIPYPFHQSVLSPSKFLNCMLQLLSHPEQSRQLTHYEVRALYAQCSDHSESKLNSHGSLSLGLCRSACKQESSWHPVSLTDVVDCHVHERGLDGV